MGTNNESGHAEYVRQHSGENPDTDSRNFDSLLFNHSGFGKYTGSSIAETIRASGGDIGGGREFDSYCGTWNKVGALCATDYKWVQQEQVMQGKIIPLRKM